MLVVVIFVSVWFISVVITGVVFRDELCNFRSL